MTKNKKGKNFRSNLVVFLASVVIAISLIVFLKRMPTNYNSRLIVNTINGDFRHDFLDDYFDTKYSGVIKSQKDLEDIKSHLQAYKGDLNSLVYSQDRLIVYFADAGKYASFVKFNKAVEKEDFIELYVDIYYSDVGSSTVNFWEMPYTDKNIVFIENDIYEGNSLEY